jgi:RimJ/RimL family protein N-acetyltransferase
MHAMTDPETFAVLEPLRNGRQIEIRALRPGDRDALLRAVASASERSLNRRFFGVRREFSDAEVTAFVNVDFHQHVALIAVSREDRGELIVAGARYIVTHPGSAEIAFMVLDQYQGQGIASLMLRHLTALARAAGLRMLVAEVMPENGAMLRVFERSGLRMARRRDADLVHVTLHLT